MDSRGQQGTPVNRVSLDLLDRWVFLVELEQRVPPDREVSKVFRVVQANPDSQDRREALAPQDLLDTPVRWASREQMA